MYYRLFQTGSQYSHIFNMTRVLFSHFFFFRFVSPPVIRYLRRVRGEGIKCIQSRISSVAYSYDKIGDMDEIWRRSFACTYLVKKSMNRDMQNRANRIDGAYENECGITPLVWIGFSHQQYSNEANIQHKRLRIREKVVKCKPFEFDGKRLFDIYEVFDTFFLSCHRYESLQVKLINQNFLGYLNYLYIRSHARN